MHHEAGLKRLGALIVDIIIIAIIFYVIGKVTGNAKGGSVNLKGGPALINFAVDFLYFIILEALFGATVGKMLLGLRVVKTDGSKLGWGGSIIRNLLRIVDGFPYVIPYLLGAIVMWVSPNKQRLGDMAGGTVVTDKQSVSSAG